jgi:preprotein translocase subunit SecE
MEHLGNGDIFFIAKMVITVTLILLLTCWAIDYIIIMINQFNGIL